MARTSSRSSPTPGLTRVTPVRTDCAVDGGLRRRAVLTAQPRAAAPPARPTPCGPAQRGPPGRAAAAVSRPDSSSHRGDEPLWVRASRSSATPSTRGMLPKSKAEECRRSRGIGRLDMARALYVEVLVPHEVHEELVEERPDADNLRRGETTTRGAHQAASRGRELRSDAGPGRHASPSYTSSENGLEGPHRNRPGCAGGQARR